MYSAFQKLLAESEAARHEVLGEEIVYGSTDGIPAGAEPVRRSISAIVSRDVEVESQGSTRSRRGVVCLVEKSVVKNPQINFDYVEILGIPPAEDVRYSVQRREEDASGSRWRLLCQ